MTMLRHCSTLLALGIGIGSAAALETRLRLGPNEITAEAAVLNRYVDEGVTRIDAATLHVSGSVRFLNIGVNVDAYTALDKDEPTRVKAGEIDRVVARLDYRYDLLGLVHLFPYYETSLYPATGSSRSWNGVQADPTIERRRWDRDAHWLGVDAWYMLPWLGLEVGAGVAYDLTDNAGWKGSVGSRQFFQIPPLDIALYQKLNFAYGNYRDYTIGLDRTGLTTAEAGAALTLPLPLEFLFVSIFGSGHVWIDGKSRDVVERKTVLVGGVSVSLRLSELGL